MCETKILNYEAISDSRLGIKGASDAVDTLRMFESGDIVVSKDGILSLQNTTRENYPTIINTFIADINKTVSMVLKSIVFLHSNDKTRSMLLDDVIIFGHKVTIQNGTVISLKVKEASDSYFNNLKKHIAAINTFLQDTRSIANIKPENLKSLQSTFHEYSCHISKEDAVFLSGMHPKLRGKHLRNIPKHYYENNQELNEAIRFWCKNEHDDWSETIFYSINLYDFKLTPKKSLVMPIRENDNAERLELLFLDGCRATTRGWSALWYALPDFSVDFYMKKYLIEKITGARFEIYIGACRDYLFRDRFLNHSDGDNWNQQHPLVIECNAVSRFEKKIMKLKESHDGHMFSLSKLRTATDKSNITITMSDYYTRFSNENPGVDFLIARESLKAPTALTDIFNTITKTVATKAKEILNDFLRTDHNSKQFVRAKEEELFLFRRISNILDYFYQNSDTQTISVEQTKKLFRERATFHTTLLDSIVFDFRAGAKQEYNEAAKEFLGKLPEADLLYEIMKNHPYHDFYEFDPDFYLSKDSKIGIEELLSFLKASSLLNLPVRFKSGLKLRKLGNYKAAGIYFSHSRMLGLDFRDGVESYIHEMAHHIDLNKTFNDRKRMVRVLRAHFDNIIKDRRDYYLSGDELIARAAEVSVILKSSNYMAFSKTLRDNPNELISKLKSSFEKSKESKFMFGWDTYGRLEPYINIEDAIKSKNFILLDFIYEYFSGFWGWNNSAKASFERFESIQKGSYARESPYSESHRSFDFYMGDIYKLEYDKFDKDNFLKITLDFVNETLPIGIAPAFDLEQNIVTIKKMWSVYCKCENEARFLSILKENSIHVSLDEESLDVVRRDFENKFGQEDRYCELKTGLEKTIELLSRADDY